MVTGREALFSVEQAISRVRADENQLDVALRSAMDEAARLRREETAGFRALARAKLDVMVRDKVVDDLDATEQRALAMIEGHRRQIEQLARRRSDAQAALDRAETGKHDRDQDLADAIEALDQQRDRTAERIKSDPSWQAAGAAVEAARKVAANADQKAALAEADLATKGRPYEDDPLFMYLWRKKHGQAEDASGRLVRFVDRKIARLINYQDARANYAMLQEIPARLREHAKNKQNDVEVERQRVTDIERKALVADGIEPLEARANAAQAAMTAAAEEVAKITAGLQQIEADRQKALGVADEAVYDQAVGQLAQALSQEDLRQLYQEAVRTATKADDQAIVAISGARTALQKTDGEVAQIRGQIREMAVRRSELEGARDRARSSGYGDPRGTFGGGQDMLGAVIGGILAGALQGGALDRVLRDNYRSPGRRSDPDFGGRGEAPSWPNPWSPGPADSGRGPGDDAGGGWRTGGSF
jgi:hypothetical protein